MHMWYTDIELPVSTETQRFGDRNSPKKKSTRLYLSCHHDHKTVYTLCLFLMKVYWCFWEGEVEAPQGNPSQQV